MGGGGVRAGTENPDFFYIFGSVGRDPFAEDDGGPPLESGRIMVAATAARTGGAVDHGPRAHKKSTDDIDVAMGRRKEGKTPPPPVVAGGAPRRPAVSVLEDLWKLDMRTLLWDRVRGAGGLFGAGKAACVVSVGGESQVFKALQARRS